MSEESKAGRPREYDPKYCDDLIEYMSKGGSLETFGAHLGEKYGKENAVGRNAVWRWAKQYPEFEEAKEIAEAYSQKFFEDIGNRGMLGQLRTVSTEIVDPETGKVVQKKYRTAFFNDRVWKLNMQNRFGWRDRRENDNTSSDGSARTIVQVNIPSNGREVVENE